MKNVVAKLPLFALCMTLAGLAPPAAAGKLLLSGGAYSDTNTDLFVNGLRKATGRDASFTPNINSTSNCGTNWATTACPRIAVITAAKDSYATGLDAFNNDIPASGSSPLKRGYYNLFQTHGFAPKFITAHVDNYGVHSSAGTTQGQANIAIINQADAVWFVGGDQAKIIRTLLTDSGADSGLAAALRSRWNNGSGSLVIAGDSAGNHALNVKMHAAGVSYGYLYYGADLPDTAVTGYATLGDTRDGTSALRYLENGATMTALGFLPAGILSDTHFDTRSGRLGRLAAALRDLGVAQGFGVDEDTGVLVDTSAQTATVYGTNKLLIVDTASASVQTGTYYKVNGLRVSLLTPGDKYNYSSKVVTSSKSAIGTAYYYSSAYDSADIFAALETSKSLTRTVDQTPTVNIGTAPVPAYTSGPTYPSGAPTIRLRFTRDATSKGYYASGKYTVDKVKVDIY
ncbi:cyanophycinase [Roseateles sp.]|uniref:cyanophycinase n=1 Tax=Roseateles sp. TaxID=1971397 RepID=UPI003BAB3151